MHRMLFLSGNVSFTRYKKFLNFFFTNKNTFAILSKLVTSEGSTNSQKNLKKI